MRGILIDPWARRVEAVEVPVVPRNCGCHDADGLALAELLGRQQKLFVVLDGECLIVGTTVSGPRWWWGSAIEVRRLRGDPRRRLGPRLRRRACCCGRCAQLRDVAEAPGDGAGGVRSRSAR